jgi:RNA polymerase sigma-70 factor (ECF subfamily)
MFNEAEVIGRILNGDLRAFELLVKQYERLVFYVVHRLVKDDDAAQDVCQEVFIKVHKSLVRFGFQSKLSTWIARIAYLTAINYIRKYNRERTSDYPDDLENYHFTAETPEQQFTKKETASYVEQLVQQLPEKYRAVLTLYHLNEFSCREIEEITGMPEGTVKNYLHRARKLLKEKLEVYLKNELP